MYDIKAINLQLLAKRLAAARVVDITHIWDDHACGPWYADSHVLQTECPEATPADRQLFAQAFTIAYRSRLISHAETACCFAPAQLALVKKYFG
jgi:hypothetical protein